jgi:Xaa-Pro aminopeptidase
LPNLTKDSTHCWCTNQRTGAPSLHRLGGDALITNACWRRLALLGASRREALVFFNTTATSANDDLWRAGVSHRRKRHHRRPLNQLTDAAPDVEWIATKDLVEDLRVVKDESEIALMRRAARIADEGFEFLCRTLRPGMTEHEAAWELEARLRTHGADKIAFDLIVGSGPGGAEPLPQRFAVIAASEPIVLDLGAQVNGYNSDLTRTICLGQPKDDRFMEIYSIVLRAQETALNGIRAGMTGIEADQLARDVIVAAGYGDNFGHGLGHGVGLAVHEEPRAGRLAEGVIPAGSTLTVEPGIYLPGWGGVRIEDLTLVDKNGVQLLSHASKEPLVL